MPTYRRPDVLALCLEHLCNLDALKPFEVLIYDNGAPADSRLSAEAFHNRLMMTYTLNPSGHGLGYSLRRGLRECRGERIVEMNDDALVPADFLTRLDAIFASDSHIGVVGVRAVEDKYASQKIPGIGLIDSSNAEVVGNFNHETTGIIDVDHVYGFCYAYTREFVEKGGRHDSTLLAKDYSSGNRLETDHCLTAKRLGFRVVYDGTLAVRHLAKPRGDINERSLNWKLNHTRNTLYLYLKHFGFLGNRCMALRFAFLKDVGILSAIKQPTKSNWLYFLTGFRARASAFWHYLRYLVEL